MRIAINTRLLIADRLDGIGWFTAETVRRMIHQHPEHEFYLFFDRKPDLPHGWKPLPANAHPIKLNPPARHPILWYIFFEWSVRNALKRYHIDLFLSTDGWMTLHTNTPTLDVIHDLNFEHDTHNLRPVYQAYMKYFFPRFARNAARIATVSEFSKQDIAATYNLPLEKIDVVYDGAHEYYRPCAIEEQQETKENYTQGNPYFLFVGSIIPRKNLRNLFLAFDRFKINDTTNAKLLVVGAKVDWNGDLENTYNQLGHASDVIFLGRVEAAELAKLMGSALALAYPSFFEGFGIPILEAFCTDTPVITSNLTSMPEVAGDAALLINPYSVEELASALYQIANDADLRDSLIKKGRLQRQKFSWDHTSQLLWESLMQIDIPTAQTHSADKNDPRNA